MRIVETETLIGYLERLGIHYEIKEEYGKAFLTVDEEKLTTEQLRQWKLGAMLKR